MTTGDKAELLPIGYVCANNGSGGLQVCDKNATGAMPIYASDLERRAPPPPSEVVEDVIDDLAHKLVAAMNGATGIFFVGKDNEWCVRVDKTDQAAGVSGVPEAVVSALNWYEERCRLGDEASLIDDAGEKARNAKRAVIMLAAAPER